MELKKAIILCAGFGKRVMPLTKDTPKPLLKINNLELIEYSIKLLNNLGITEIAINAHYLKDKIKSFVDLKYPKIKIFNEDPILDTGGALVNAKDFLGSEYFAVLNSDTVWQKNYIQPIIELKNHVIKNNLLGGLLLAKKEKSFDENLKPDFGVDNDLMLINEKKYIYTGFQILSSKTLVSRKAEFFSVKKIWDDLIEQRLIAGKIFEDTFYHTTDFDIYNKLNSQNLTY